MLKQKRTRSLAAAFLFMFLFSGQRIFAYIDPGTGSYMIQIAIAFMVGALFFIKGFWKKIAAFLSRIFSKKKNDSGSAL